MREGSDLVTIGDCDAPAIRRRVLGRIASEVGYDMAVFYTVRVGSGGPYQTGELVVGAPDLVATTTFDRCRQRPEVAFSLTDHQRVRLRERTNFLEDGALWTGTTWRDSSFVRDILAPIGMLHQQRMLVYQGRRFVGWVGGLREPAARPFGPRERARARRWVSAVTAALVAADRLELVAVSGPPGDLVVRPDGHVTHACAAGYRWLARPGFADQLRRMVQAFDAGREETSGLLGLADARIARLVGEGECRYVVNVAAARPPSLTAVACLTPSQGRVAEYAAAGATDAETARALGIRPSTVKHQLRAIYELLGVASRLELARALADRDGEGV